MNRPVIAAFVLLAFAGGLGVGYLMRGGAESAPEQVAEQPDQPRENSGRATGANEPSDSPGNGNSAAGGITPDRGAGKQPEIKSSVIGDLARAIAGIDAGEIPQGDGVITGKVTGPNGEPLEGVQVLAWPSVPWRPAIGWRAGGGHKPKPDIESLTRKQIRSVKRDAMTRREALTGSDGTYRIEGLAGGSYRTAAYAKGFEFSHADRGQARGVIAGATVDFTSVELVKVPVKVLMPDGSAAADAKIKLTEKGGERRRASYWSPIHPDLYLQPGRYTCQAESGDYEEYCSDEVEVVVESGGEIAEVTLRLKGRTGVRGRLKVPPGEYYEHLYVHLAAYRSEKKPDILATGISDFDESVWQMSGYRFEFWDLKPGRYLLAVVVDENILVEATVDLGDVLLVRDLQIPDLKRADHLVVWVYGPDGEPVKTVSISTGYSFTGGSASRGVNTIKRPDGSFWIQYPKGQTGKGEVTYTVFVEVHGLGTRKVEYTRGPNAEVEVRFKPPAYLAVTITGYEGSELDGELYLTTVKSWGRDWGRGRVTKSDGNGTFRLGRVEPGLCSFAICLPNDSWGGLRLATHTLTVVAGENFLTVALPRLNPLTVSAPDAEPGANVSVSAVTDEENPGGGSVSFSIMIKLGDNGSATFRHVPTGLCRISMYYKDSEGETVYGGMKIRVPEQSNVIFAPE